MAIKFGVFLPQGFVYELAGYTDPVEAFETLVQVAKTVDECGFETLWVADHMVTMPPSPSMVFEGWTTLTALLMETQRVRIGHLVNCNNYRNPALHAKMASTVDVISRGRYTFGIGCGNHPAEYQSYGYSFDGDAERLRQLRESVEIILAMWTQEKTTFAGKYYQVDEAINSPKGVQQPHIPLLIAGGGEKVTLKLVAEFADACNVTDSPQRLKHKFDVLKNHCETVGRDYNSIHRTVQTHCVMADSLEEATARIPQWAPFVFPGDFESYCLVGPAATIRERIAAYEAAGVQELVISFPDTVKVDSIRQFAAEFIT
jgi:F420-dependent oxidoreductase-like protein